MDDDDRRDGMVILTAITLVCALACTIGSALIEALN